MIISIGANSKEVGDKLAVHVLIPSKKGNQCNVHNKYNAKM